ncbi:MAG TPA: hypothetical protein VGF95_03840 [Solirubrobacteraceae bacterium]|jgi:hypothetical protein
MHSVTEKTTRLRARLARFAGALVAVGGVSLMLSQSALADYGRGMLSDTSDKAVTVYAFLLLIFLLLVICLFSTIQWALDKRKAARKAAQHAPISGVDWNGGW